MKIFCIPNDIADKLKEAAIKGEFDIAKMYEMSSAERRALFEKYVNTEMSTFINTEFERAMVSDSTGALKRWAEKTFNAKEKKTEVYHDVLSKIDSLNDTGVLTPDSEKAFLSDLVATKLGMSITTDQARTIADKAKALQALKEPLESIGDPTYNPKGQMEYFKAKRDMEDYLESLTPASKIRVLTSTIARGNMLARIGSILVNINSNNIEGVSGAIVRRFEARAIGGQNTDYMGKLLKFNSQIFKETGYDLTRIISLESDRKILGEEISTSQGPGLVRKAGRWYEDKIFKMTQGLPDVMAASIAFGDRANIMSTKIALGEGLKGPAAKTRALELFKDATNVEPKTDQGIIIRNTSVADAQRSTNTDKRILAEKGLAFRKLLNVGDLRFGDMNIPFVKTTANAIQSGLEHSGVLLPVDIVIDTLKTIKTVQSGEGWGSATKKGFGDFGTKVVRAGIGFLAAYLVANAIDPEDYVGVYPTTAKERELLELKKASANSIKVFGNWISLDWFGPLMAPLVGHLNAKKYGKDGPSSAYFYGAGALYQVQRAPGLDFARQSLDSLATYLTSTTATTPSKVAGSVANYFVDFIQSRFLPGIVSQIAQATDTVVRETSSKEDILAPIKGAIPGIRQTLSENLNVFGETTSAEGWKVLIFGARVKGAKDDMVVDELTRLEQAGQLPSITDVSKTSPRAQELKDQIGAEKIKAFQVEFGQALKKDITKKITSFSYKRMNDEDKKKAIEDLKSKDFDHYLKRYGYKKPKK